MSKASPEKKQSVLKTLAIIGFIGIIIIIAWASVQLVNVLPSAFSSLASLAEGVNQYQSSASEEADSSSAETIPINVTSDTSLVVSGTNTVDLSWDATDTPGTYALSYECVPGLSAVLIAEDQERELVCDTNYNLGDVETATLSLNSTENRYADFRYEVAFLRTNDTEPSGTGNAAITVFNTDVENIQAPEPEAPEATVTESTETSSETGNPEDETTETSTTEPTAPSSENDLEDEAATPAPTPTQPTYEQEYTYAIPSSDPNGRTDLGMRFLSTGIISNNRFVPTELERGTTGAVQFAVKNYGTKTSAEWTYTVDLPTGGVYVSPEQAPLKPNERAVLTIGFPATDTNSFTIVGTVRGGPESTLINNQFTETVFFD